MTSPLAAATAMVAVVSVVLGVSSTSTGIDPTEAAPSNARSRSTTTQAATTTTTAPLRHLTLAASGDILLHDPVMRDAQANAGGSGYNFDPMFDDVRGLISAADLAICHQETPISADDTDMGPSESLIFNVPREIGSALRNAGFRACDTASNHTWDRGLAGVQQTLDVLDEAGIGHAGSARNQEEADQPPIYDVKGVKVGHLAYSYSITNDTARPDPAVPPEAPWLVSMLWPALGVPGMLDMAHRLKERGAEFVVMSIHWGDQYVRQPNAEQRQLAKDLLASPDVDLILGDHVHVVQPCEKIDGKYVIYGMGNFLSNQARSQAPGLTDANQDGSLETYTVDEVSPGRLRVTKMTYAPTWVEMPGHRIVRATPDHYGDSYNRTVEAMNLLGPDACDAQPAS